MKNISLFFLLLILPLSALADLGVSRLMITTDPQTVKPGVISDKITAQAQNGSGESQVITDTAHLSLETTSTTGEFSSSETNWKSVISLTMSKNTANRSFYYRDSTIGTYTITVQATDGQSWTPATQTITISDSALASPTPSGSPAVTPVASSTEPTPTPEPPAVTGGSYMVYSSSASLSAAEAHPPKIGAGRNRLAVVGWPIKFSAVIEGNSSGLLRWSFGDGTIGEGNQISHSYNFPGEYNVILNGTFSGGEAVARTKVKIIQPLVVIKNVNGGEGYIELENQDASEVNLNDWLIQNKTGSFKIPTDTIISGQTILRIPLASTKLSLADQDNFSLFYPDGKSVAVYAYLAQNTIGKDMAIRQQKLQDISTRLKQLGSQVSLLLAQKALANHTEVSPPAELASDNQPANQIDEDVTSPTSTVAPTTLSQAAGVIVLDNQSTIKSKTQGWFGKTWQWLGDWWK